jgi:uncharacterized protein (DUF362 family)
MKQNQHHDDNRGYPCKHLSRRGFISALGVTTAGLVATACNKAVNPLQSTETGQHLTSPSPLPPRTLPNADPNLSRVTIANIDNYDYTALKREITAMIDGLGGLSDIIKPGDKVAMKINLTGGAGSYMRNGIVKGYEVGPCELYWSHPTIAKIIFELVKDAGAGQLYLVESYWDEKCYTDYGFKDVVDYLGATRVDLNKKEPYAAFGEYPVGAKKLLWDTFTHNQVLHEIDCFISLAKAKQHAIAGQTHTMKNLVGTVPKSLYDNGGGHRIYIHNHTGAPAANPVDLVQAVLDLNMCRPVNLGFNDAIKTCLGTEGPWTKLIPRTFNTLIASKDPVAADAVSTSVIGFDPMAADYSDTFPETINYLKLAEELGMGIHDLNNIEVVNTTQNTGVAHRNG